MLKLKIAIRIILAGLSLSETAIEHDQMTRSHG